MSYINSMDDYIDDYINKVMGKSFAQMDDSFEQLEDKLDRNAIQDFVRETINKSLGNKLAFSQKNYKGYNSNNSSKLELLKIHGYYIMRIPVPEDINVRSIEAFLHGDEVIIRWNGADKEQRYQLPSNSLKVGVKGIVKDRILELRIPENNEVELKRINLEFM